MRMLHAIPKNQEPRSVNISSNVDYVKDYLRTFFLFF